MKALAERITQGEMVYSPDRSTHDYVIHRKNPIVEFSSVCHEDGVVGSSEWIWLSDDDAEFIVEAYNATHSTGMIPGHNWLLVWLSWRRH